MTQYVTCPDCLAYEAELKDKDRLLLALADRVCKQSELLGRVAEKETTRSGGVNKCQRKRDES